MPDGCVGVLKRIARKKCYNGNVNYYPRDKTEESELNRKKIKGFLRGFYITLIALSMLLLVAFGTCLAQENTQRIGYGESCLPAQSESQTEVQALE